MNNIKAKLITRPVKGDPKRSWTGLSVVAEVDGVIYEGLLFEKRSNDIDKKDEIKFVGVNV